MKSLAATTSTAAMMPPNPSLRPIQDQFTVEQPVLIQVIGELVEKASLAADEVIGPAAHRFVPVHITQAIYIGPKARQCLSWSRVQGAAS